MFVDVSDARLWVEEDGEGPLLIVPTYAGVEFYRRTLSRRLRSQLHVIYVEMRGSGGSTGALKGHTFADLSDDVEAARVGLGLPPAVVLGHSNHGCIAVEHALRHPSGSRGIICVGSPGDGRASFDIGQRRWAAEATPEQQADLAGRREAFAADIGPHSPDVAAVRRYISIAPLAWRDPDAAWSYWGSYPAGVAEYFTAMGANMMTWSPGERLGALAVPLLAISGRNDYLCPVETWDDAIGAAPGARRVVFEASAHNPQVEEQDAFDALVLDAVRTWS